MMIFRSFKDSCTVHQYGACIRTKINIVFFLNLINKSFSITKLEQLCFYPVITPKTYQRYLVIVA